MFNKEVENYFVFSGWKRNRLFLTISISLLLAVTVFFLGKPSPEQQARKIKRLYPASEQRKFKTLSTVLFNVKNNYLDPEKIRPVKMFSFALENLEKTTPEIITNKKDNKFTLGIKELEHPFDLDKINTILDLYKNLLKAFNIITLKLPDIDLKQLEYNAIGGILSTLDPHTSLLSPDIYREIKTGTRGSFNGIGIVLTKKDGFLTIISAIDETPAARAGIQTGDRIVKINSISVVNMLRGKPDTWVTLWISRDNQPDLKRFRLKRTIIHVSSVNSKVINEKTGYVRITQFTNTTARELKNHINMLKKHQVETIILDLYNNPGGLLKEAKKSADLFLDNGVIFSTVSNNQQPENIQKALPENTIWQKRLIVLINKGSASAAEILAGSLRYNNRALIVGEKSFGKGSIQTVNENEDGSALKMTIAHYLSAGKHVIQSRGVNPHIVVRIIDVKNKNSPLFSTKSTKVIKYEDKQNLQKFPPEARPWSFIKVVNQQISISPLNETNSTPNSLIKVLVEFSNKVQGKFNDRDKVVSWFEKYNQRALTTLFSLLGKNGIDWSVDTNKGKPIFDSSIRFESGMSVEAGKKLKGKVVLRNLGTAPFFRMRLLIKKNKTSNFSEILIGKLFPGEKKEIPFSYYVDISSPATIWPFKIKYLAEKTGTIFLNKTSSFNIRILPAPKPEFKVHYHLMDNLGGNGDGLCQYGEKLRFRLMVTNKGDGSGENTIINIIKDFKEKINFSKARFVFGRLLPGETRIQDLSFVVPADFPNNFLKFTVQIRDEISGRETSFRMVVPVHNLQSSPLTTNGYFEVKKKALIYNGMDKKSVGLGIARRGSIFLIRGIRGKWIKILLSPERTAFILRSSGKVNTIIDDSLLKPHWEPIYQIISPKIDIIRELPLLTSRNKVKINALISHPLHLKDIVVERVDGQGKYKKIAFIDGKQKKRIRIEQIIQLNPGKNLVGITARVSNELGNSWNQYIIFKKQK
jgi:carboxyl-terminal processing protease